MAWFWPQASGLFLRLEKNATLRPILECAPDIMERPFRVDYLVHGWNTSRRLAQLHRHLDAVECLLSPQESQKIWGDKHHPILDIPLQNGEGLTLALFTQSPLDREGEIGFGLFDRSGQRLYYLTFSFERRERGALWLLIGSIKGPGDEEGRDLVRDLTKQIHRMRPRDLLVTLFQYLGQLWGVQGIMAVRTEAHCYNYSRKMRRRIKVDYNQIWEEQGGEPLDRLFYRLPVMPVRKTLEEVSSNKRAQYRRRFEWLDGLAEGLAQWDRERRGSCAVRWGVGKR